MLAKCANPSCSASFRQSARRKVVSTRNGPGSKVVRVQGGRIFLVVYSLLGRDDTVSGPRRKSYGNRTTKDASQRTPTRAHFRQ
jgi:hypothetical protein